MMRSVIRKQLTKNLFLTFLISSVLTFLGVHAFYADTTGSLEGNQVVFIIVIMSICWIFILTLCSLTVYLNLYDNIRGNRVYCTLAFFLLPVFLILVMFSLDGFDDMWKSFAITSGTFVITHFFFYIRFLKGGYDKDIL
jgi:hypothetical protein